MSSLPPAPPVPTAIAPDLEMDEGARKLRTGFFLLMGLNTFAAVVGVVAHYRTEGVVPGDLTTSFWMAFACLLLMALSGVCFIKMQASAHRQLRAMNTGQARHAAELADLQAQLDAAREDILHAADELARSARTDVATGAMTRTAFMSEVNREIESSRRSDVPMCILALEPVMLDERESPQHMHQLCQVLLSRLRTSDRVAVVSPGQVAVLLHNTTIMDAEPACAGFVSWLETEHTMRVSAGLSEMVINRDKAESLLGRAVQALKHASEAHPDRFSVIDGNPPVQHLRSV